MHYIIIVAIIAIVGVGCAYFMSGRHGDGGLFETGEKANGPDLDGDGIPNDVYWPRSRLPIKIILSPAISDKYKEHISKAVDEVNKIVPVFSKYFDTPSEKMSNYIEIGGAMAPSGHCYIMEDSGDEPHKGVTTTHRTPDGVIVSCTVQLPRSALDKPRVAANVVLHELLHVIGLAHDENPKSIMFPISDGRNKIVEKSDVELLRKIYQNEKK